MVSKYRKKTTRGETPTEVIQKAVLEVLTKNVSLHQAAKQNNMNYTTLRRYCLKYSENKDTELRSNYDTRRVFTNEQEQQLAAFVIKCSQVGFGFTTRRLRILASQLAVQNNLNYPSSWVTEGCAGRDWYRAFLKRTSALSLRTPLSCSLSRAASFNRTNVELFFTNLQSIYSKHGNFENGTRIYNLDETSTTTVPNRNPKVVAEKGCRLVVQSSSAKRGVLVTTTCFISAAGTFLPPVMIFPRRKFTPRMLYRGPPGATGLVHPSGWQTTETFVAVMKHFIKHSNATPDMPVLLIFDNVECHLSLEAVRLAKENGIIILTIPPHSSHKMQPLDRCVFKAFKHYYDEALITVISRLAYPLQIYDVAECVNKAMDLSFNPGSIKKSFEKTGIYPFDRTVFKAVDFLTSTVTSTVNPTGVVIPPNVLDTFQPDGVDPNLNVQADENFDDCVPTLNVQADENFDDCDKGSPVNNEGSPVNNEGSPVNNEGSPANTEGSPTNNEVSRASNDGSLANGDAPENDEGYPSSSNSLSHSGTNHANSSSNRSNVSRTPKIVACSSSSFRENSSPEDLMPLPKAKSATMNRKPSQKGRSFIPTDTPEKLKLELAAEEKGRKRKVAEEREKKRMLKSNRRLEFCDENSEDVDGDLTLIKKRQTKRKIIPKDKKKIKRCRTSVFLERNFESSGSGLEEKQKLKVAKRKNSRKSIQSSAEDSVSFEETDVDAGEITKRKAIKQLTKNSELSDKNDRNICEGDYVIVSLKSDPDKKNSKIKEEKCFAQIEKVVKEDDDDDFEYLVSFLKPSIKFSNGYTFPDEKDRAYVQFCDILQKIQPRKQPGTARQQRYMYFDVEIE